MNTKLFHIPGWAYLVMAAAAALLSVCLHARLCFEQPAYDPSDDTIYFQVESALQYRYARMLAAGENVPALDTRAQYPEGLRTGREISLWMEHATAFTSRLLYGSPPRPYHTFVILWVCALSGISVLACYLAGLALAGETPAALAAAILFGVCWIGSTVTTGVYGFQTFALPLLFLAVGCFGAALNGTRRSPAVWAAAGAAAFAAALVSWHFTRFFLLAFWLGLGYAAWRGRGDEPALKRLRLCASSLLMCCAAAGLGAPVLRETAFIFSPAFLAGLALLACLTLRPGLLVPVLAAAGLAVFWQAGREAGSYGHVYALLWEKLRFALVKPEDPLLLAREARYLWTGPFNSPPAGYLIFAFLPLAFAAAPRLWRAVKGPPVRDPAGALCDALLLIYAAGTLLVQRLAPILAFFLCIASLRRREDGPRGLWLTACLLGLAFFETLKTLAPLSPANMVMPLASLFAPAEIQQPAASHAETRLMLDWLRVNGKERPVAADFGISASVLAYTPSPVLLHPKFESAAIRNKNEEYLKALYSDEKEFFAFCRKYGAGLFVYSSADGLDWTRDSFRYMAGVSALKVSMAAVKFHFFPEKLEHFRLLYENASYRIFAVGEPGAAPRARRAVYDLKFFDPIRTQGGGLTIDAAGVLRRMNESETKLRLAWIYLSLDRPEKALPLYEEAFAAWPPEEDQKREYERLRAALASHAAPSPGPELKTAEEPVRP